MAGKDDGQVAFDPKHRIVGAIILVSLAVIFIPMILDEREPPVKADAVAEIPARSTLPAEPPDAGTQVVVARLDAPAAAPAASAPESSAPPAAAAGSSSAAPASRPATAAPANRDTESVEKAEKASETPPLEKTASAPAPRAAKGGWVVQIGAFTDFDNVVHLREQLRRHGHAVSTENVVQGGKKLIRLQVGPFADRHAALEAQARIKKEIGVQGVVLAHR